MGDRSIIFGHGFFSQGSFSRGSRGTVEQGKSNMLGRYWITRKIQHVGAGDRWRTLWEGGGGRASLKVERGGGHI